MTKPLHPDEQHLTGAVVVTAEGVIPDTTMKRIEALVGGDTLVLVAASDDGWKQLYRDRMDGRYWELFYPDAGHHGGGAPSLRHLPLAVAKSRYAL